ncbi:MAG: hypothetical protein WDZ30_04515 [Cellvibrionaceae bacterium]
MNRFLSHLLMTIALMTTAITAVADITGASVTPTQQQLAAGTTNNISLSWQVTTTSAHAAVTTSGSASYVDPDTGAVIGTMGMAFTAAGPGPLTFNETLAISAAQISGWQTLGLTRVLLRRVFLDSGSSATATAAVNLLLPEGLTGVRVSPTQRQVFGSGNNTLSLTWQVAASGDYSDGVRSTSARIVDPRTQATLATVGGELLAAGSGPYSLSEMLSIDPALVNSWVTQGRNRLLLVREFANPLGGPALEATMLLMPGRSQLTAGRNTASGELTVQGLRLEFETGNNTTLADINSELQARLTVLHSGSGLLEGRWLVAEPGSTEGEPLFRTLALARSNLTSGQRNILSSPKLPTNRVGKYLLRFCVTDSNPNQQVTNSLSSQCPSESLIVDAAYQVQGEGLGVIGSISGLSPSQRSVNANTVFSWQPVPEARIYQLHVSTLDRARLLPALGTEEGMVKPEFVVGMVLSAGTIETPLSELVRSKLEAGKQYLWRITAHDDLGHLIASSGENSFSYEAEENHGQ